MKHKIYIGIYESMSNCQICFVSTKKMWFAMDLLEEFIESKFRNFTKITFIAESPNDYIACKEIDYKEYEKYAAKKDSE